MGIGTHTKMIYSLIIIVSIVVSTVTVSGDVFAADNGGYPWADATLIRAATYDWGYTVCQPLMEQAKTCSAHNSYKNAVKYYESDPWKYDVKNCTSFVAWRVNQAYKLNLVGWGDAKNWDTMGQKAGYNVNNQPNYGDIAVWNSGNYGHVAFVTQVNGDGSVNVEQYNKAGKGEYSRQSRVRADTYIHIAPIISFAPPRAIPTNSQTVISNVTTNTPITPLPDMKKTLENKESVQPQAVPVKQVSSFVETNTTDDVSYYVGSTSTKGVRAYAIKHNNTTSGKLEIHTADVTTDSTKWSEESVTPESIQQPQLSSYAIADQNADGNNDIYKISYSNTDTKKVEINILDGSREFKTYLGKWTMDENQHLQNEVSYEIADQNGDGKLDLYQIWHSNTFDNLIHITVFDGQSGYKKILLNMQLPESTHDYNDVYYMIGDHNDDGTIDIYQILHNNTSSGKTEIKVFDGSSESSNKILSHWSSYQPLYKGAGPSFRDI